MTRKKKPYNIIKKRGNEKNIFKRIWRFVWDSDSIWSWIIDLVLLYVLVKFVFFPVMSLATGASLPSVIVESDSMHHIGNFDMWWNNFGRWYEKNSISKQEIGKWPFLGGINKGDIIIVVGRNKEDIKVGDVIIFDAGQAKPIIHRVIKISDAVSTKGDNNIDQLSVEKSVPYNRIIGKAVFRIPKAGWAKLFFVEIAKKLFQK